MTTKEKKRIEIDIDTYMELMQIGKKLLQRGTQENITPNVYASVAMKRILDDWKNDDQESLKLDSETASSLAILESAGMGNRHDIASKAIRDYVARHKEEALQKISMKLGV